MRHIILLLAAGFALGTLAPQAGAAPRRVGEGALVRPAGFVASGTVTGMLRGVVVMDNVQYQIPAEASVYVVGRGLSAPGVVLKNRQVSFIGVRSGGLNVVRQIIVRPEGPVVDARDAQSPHVGVLARDARR